MLVADPPAPPVPLPINRVSVPSVNANSALANDVGADDPVDLLILKVFAMLEVSSVYKIFNGASLICFKCTTTLIKIHYRVVYFIVVIKY
jgi:hypothetical protein